MLLVIWNETDNSRQSYTRANDLSFWTSSVKNNHKFKAALYFNQIQKIIANLMLLDFNCIGFKNVSKFASKNEIDWAYSVNVLDNLRVKLSIADEP